MAERLQRQLGGVDLARGRPGRPRCRTAPSRPGTARRLLGARHAELARERPHLLLADAGLEQRVDHPVLGGGEEPRPPVADVVGVRAGEDRREPARARRAQPARRRAPSCSGSSGRGHSRGSPPRESSAVVIVSCAMPTARATSRAPSSSPVASAGETAVTASARSPSARAASAATRDESTPPEKATNSSRASGSGPGVPRSSSWRSRARARASAQTDFTGGQSTWRRPRSRRARARR